ncbi:MAG: PEP-CTERM sorting domain-containing protein [Rubrivivax sp.]|nr:PEP-CTERM sorting domain-containing protein [Rubrivivax sp.]
MDRFDRLGRILASAAAGLLLATLSAAAHAGFVGITLNAYYAYNTIDTPYAFATATPSTFTVADAGIDTTVDVEGVTTIAVDFSDNSVRIVFNTNLTLPTWNVAPFNGLVFDAVAPSLIDFTTATIDPTTTMAGFDSARVVLEAGRLGFNWNGLSYVDGTVLKVNFGDPRQLPEPGTLALVGALLGLLALGARRRA